MLKGKKIKLRAYKETEAEEVWKLIEEDGIKEYLMIATPFPYSLESEKNFLKMAMTSTGELFNFAVESLESGKYVGGCGISDVDRKNSVATVGLWLGKEYHGKGLGSDTLRTLCKFIFDEMNIHKIKLFYFDFNKVAKQCYDSVGFVEEGRLRKTIYRYGKYHDEIVMGLFRDELK